MAIQPQSHLHSPSRHFLIKITTGGFLLAWAAFSPLVSNAQDTGIYQNGANGSLSGLSDSAAKKSHRRAPLGMERIGIELSSDTAGIMKYTGAYLQLVKTIESCVSTAIPDSLVQAAKTDPASDRKMLELFMGALSASGAIARSDDPYILLWQSLAGNYAASFSAKGDCEIYSLVGFEVGKIKGIGFEMVVVSSIGGKGHILLKTPFHAFDPFEEQIYPADSIKDNFEYVLVSTADPDRILSLSYSSLARNSMASKDFEAAKKMYLSAIELDPKNAAYYCDIGVCCLKLGDISGSIDYFKKALEILPDFYPASYWMDKARKMQR